MEVKAYARYIRMSPRKVKLVIDLIRGKDVITAGTILRFATRAAAKPVLKLLNSAIANAKHNFKLDESKLFVKKIMADQGPTLKRFRPRAFGRAAGIKKRSTHITIVLDEIVKPVKEEKAPKAAKSEKKEIKNLKKEK